VRAEDITALADTLCAQAEVKPTGLGARDSLRLEAGLPLYGHDLTPDTGPVEADLTFAINKRRKAEGGFLGAERVLRDLASGVSRKRVGLSLDGRMAAREGASVMHGDETVGTVTSGGFSPSLQRPIAMGYVASHLAEPGTALKLEQRGKLFDARVAPMPFVAHRYHRKETSA
jgi:aminomethyltransferase